MPSTARRALRHTALWALAWAAVMLPGCSHLLPHSQTQVSAFTSFEQARATIESLVPQRSTTDDLRALGIDPLRSPNATVLTHADVVRRFVPAGAIERADLDPGVLECLQAREACRGIDVVAAQVASARQGSFLADFFNFVRRTEVRGWRFNAVVLLVDDRVVYRNWGGQPHIEENDVRRNPLGPLQDIGPSTISVPPPVVVH